MAQTTESYDAALAVLLANTDASDIYDDADGSGEITYEYKEEDTCTLGSVTNTTLALTAGNVHAIGGSTIALRDADPDAITIGQTDAWGSFVDIHTRFSANTVRHVTHARDTCTAYCNSGETRISKFHIQTDKPDEVAAAVRTLALACAASE
ncbi:hypothetical protein RCCS2_13929 [Roseobacter sp. CCS2]|nr:hypothetical protein RCCS2_13929 [Roseobacter sp. CCS2]